LRDKEKEEEEEEKKKKRRRALVEYFESLEERDALFSFSFLFFFFSLLEYKCLSEVKWMHHMRHGLSLRKRKRWTG